MSKLVKIVCDKCKWELAEQDILDWYKKPCPECGYTYLIDDKDMDMYRASTEFENKMNTGDITVEDTKLDSGGSPMMIMGTLSINSADLKDPTKSFTCLKCNNKLPNNLKSPLNTGKCLMCELFQYKKP